MKVGIVVFPGSNCDQDCFDVVHRLLGEAATYVWHKESCLPDVDLLILPGGFSYGDYLRAGAIARFSPIMPSIERYASEGGLLLGICNGFQILLEAGLLPGALMRNAGLKFVCKDVALRVENTSLPFTSLYGEGEVIRLPIAHADGNYYIDPASLTDLQRNRQIVFRYVAANGNLHPIGNPNGSVDDIAGICNPSGNILGMMPHPERMSEPILGGDSGIVFFRSIFNYLATRERVDAKQ